MLTPMLTALTLHPTIRYKVADPGVPMQKIANGENWFAKTFMQCRKDVLNPSIYDRDCK
jgi:hypothetical protein